MLPPPPPGSPAYDKLVDNYRHLARVRYEMWSIWWVIFAVALILFAVT